jgi:hypothetical protein
MMTIRVKHKPKEIIMDFKHYLIRKIQWSIKTFGQGKRTNGVLQHISREIEEVKGSNGSAKEWVDLVILSLDGLCRELVYNKPGMSEVAASNAAITLLMEKQLENEAREWPPVDEANQDVAIAHLKEPTADLVEVLIRLQEQEEFFDEGIAGEVSQELTLISKLAREAGYDLTDLVRENGMDMGLV